MEPTGNFASNDNGCPEWWPLLSAHADGETDPCEARELQAHVSECADCARELAGLKRFSAALGCLTPVEPPPGLQSAILASTLHRVGLAGRIRNAFRIPQVQWASMAAAGAAAAVLYSFFQLGLPAVPTRITEESTSSVPKSVIAQTGKPKSSTGPIKQHLMQPYRTVPEQEVVRLEPDAQAESRPQPMRPHVVVTASQPVSPALTTGSKSARLTALKPRIIERKPNTTLPPSGSDDAEMVMVEGGRMNDTRDAADSKIEPAPAPVPAAQPARIQLVSASSGIPPGQIATLAGLKKELQSQRLSWNAESVKESLRDKQLRFDVIRGSF